MGKVAQITSQLTAVFHLRVQADQEFNAALQGEQNLLCLPLSVGDGRQSPKQGGIAPKRQLWLGRPGGMHVGRDLVKSNDVIHPGRPSHPEQVPTFWS